MADGALRDSYNFHAIVATYAFESGHTWGQISADDDVLARWNARCANEREPEAKRALIAAQHWLASSDMAATKAVIVIEIQWALQRYMNLRKRTQLWRHLLGALSVFAREGNGAARLGLASVGGLRTLLRVMQHALGVAKKVQKQHADIVKEMTKHGRSIERKANILQPVPVQSQTMTVRHLPDLVTISQLR